MLPNHAAAVVWRGPVAIAIRREDVLSDPPAFLFARDFTQARGYRILLAGITPALASAFPPDATGIDHVELAWRPELASTALATIGLPPKIPSCSGSTPPPPLIGHARGPSRASPGCSPSRGAPKKDKGEGSALDPPGTKLLDLNY